MENKKTDFSFRVVYGKLRWPVVSHVNTVDQKPEKPEKMR